MARTTIILLVVLCGKQQSFISYKLVQIKPFEGQINKKIRGCHQNFVTIFSLKAPIQYSTRSHQEASKKLLMHEIEIQMTSLPTEEIGLQIRCAYMLP